MTKQVRVEVKEDDDEGGDISAFNPDEMLTNKASGAYTSRHDYSTPPDEDFLTNNTLWPESNKLYGHGYEIICLAVSNDGKYIASGGKAQSEKHSKLFIWNAEKSNLVCKLDGHVLTIVQIEFSKDDEFILTVSRDRSLCLYRKNQNLEEREKLPYVLVQVEKETHGRIIWGCSWNVDSSIFVTGSRDTFVKIWSKNQNQNTEKLFVETLSKEFSSAVTSVNIVPFETKIKSNIEIILIGFENGEIQLYSYDIISKTLSLISSVHQFLSHGATVKRIKSFITEENQIRVATCSDDHSARIFDIDIEDLRNLI
jgi:elongator complex protein 2